MILFYSLGFEIVDHELVAAGELKTQVASGVALVNVTIVFLPSICILYYELDLGLPSSLKDAC